MTHSPAVNGRNSGPSAPGQLAFTSQTQILSLWTQPNGLVGSATTLARKCKRSPSCAVNLSSAPMSTHKYGDSALCWGLGAMTYTLLPSPLSK